MKLSLVALVSGHGFVINPPIRNSIDKDQPGYAHGGFPLPDGSPGCTTHTGACGCWCTNGTEACESGQSCFWFSQGCRIGCDTCTGVDARVQKDLCGSGMKATVCDPELRTYNMEAACNTDADTYRHNPWRAPGAAPVFDPCGKAGGGQIGYGPGAAFFVNSTHSKEGDLGSKTLPPQPSGTLWKAGTSVEAIWGMRANHGGGYQYRLCAADEELTEACLKKTPIAFVGEQSLQFANGTRQSIPSRYVYENGTVVPQGDRPGVGAWVRNPIPDNTQAGSHTPVKHSATEFPPPCVDPSNPNGGGQCQGERPFNVAIVDILQIPPTITPGQYVLGFRWDCEETAQIWSSCADITIA